LVGPLVPLRPRTRRRRARGRGVTVTMPPGTPSALWQK